MPPINILIKPASSACNMACKYCFYRDVAEHREQAFEGMLSLQKMERVIRAGMEYADHSCSFAFQGGEPTLAGLDFYRGVVELQKKYARSGLEIHNAIQTNGMLIDEEWAAFLAENRFLVGLSLDGPAELHNLNRLDTVGEGTFNRVMRAARLMEKHRVEFNILCVVTGRNARSVEKNYRFYRRQGFRWLQFIPCLDSLEQQRGEEKYHLSAENYGDFLIRLFDLWYEDLQRGEYISIRHLDNWLSILLGGQPEVCSMTGQCAVQFVVEGDGGVYPCDFYVLDEWRMGTVGESSFAEMQRGEVAARFIQASLRVPNKCRRCRWYGLCRNGCRRNRMTLLDGEVDRNCYCEAYQRFFSQREKQLMQAARLLAQGVDQYR